jgi:hypothetical protein
VLGAEEKCEECAPETCDEWETCPEKWLLPEECEEWETCPMWSPPDAVCLSA